MKNSIKSLAISISTFLFLMGFCAGGDEMSDYSNSLFAPETANNTTLKPFFRSTSQYYWGNNNPENTYNGQNFTPNFREQNIKDWSTYFENKLDTSAISQLLYRTKPEEVDQLIFNIKDASKPLSSKLQKTKIASFENKEKSLDFLYYLGFAIRCETFSNRPNTSWEYQPTSVKNNEFLGKLIKGGQKQATNVQNAFVKERYHFQNVRLLYFNESYNACETYFEANKDSFQKDGIIYYRSLGYVAAALYKLKQYAKANYYYALMFENVASMKQTAMWSFHPQQEADWQKSLTLAQNNQEKTTLWFMMGYSNDNLRAMQQIVKLTPKSPYLDVLLTRAINIVEEEALPEIYQNPLTAFKVSKIDPKLLAFVEDQATQNSPVWSLGAGYLNLLKGNLSKAESHFKNINSNDPLMAESIKMYRAIAHIQSFEKIDSKAESELLADIKWIDKAKKTESLRAEDARQWLHKHLANVYKQQGEPIKAECWVAHSTPYFYENIAHLENMEAFLNKTNKTDYEQFIQSIYDFDKQAILEAQMTVWTYKDNIGKALEILKKGKPEKNPFLGNPFLIHNIDCHDCDHAAFAKSKRAPIEIPFFLEKLNNELNTANSATDPEAKASAYFNVANGFYNLTYWGNGRTFYQTKVSNFYSSYDLNYKEYNEGDYLKSYIFDCGLATKYYQKALEATKDPEKKAKFAFMLAKCEQNQFYLDKPQNYKGDFKAGKQFAALKTTYSKTKYYQEILKECGYFRTYLKKK